MKKEPESNAWKKRKKMAAEMLEKEKMKTVCDKCGTDNIQQQGCIMLNPNDLEKDLDWNSVIWDDYYWCMVCEEEVPVKEEKEDN